MLCVVMGVALAGIGFAVSHDAIHGAYSTDPRVNRWLGWSFDALGASSYMWKLTHNRIHHTFTNIRGLDEDLEVSPLLRLSPRIPTARCIVPAPLRALRLRASNVLLGLCEGLHVLLPRSIWVPTARQRHPLSGWVAPFAGKAYIILA